MDVLEIFINEIERQLERKVKIVRYDKGSGYFIGYLEKSKGYRFYHPSFSMRIVEFENDRFIENGKISGSTEPQNVKIQKVRMQGLCL